VGVLIGPIRPFSQDSVALEHMINATGGDPTPPPGHGVLDSGVRLVFDGVLYSETLRNTVVSVSQLTRHGFQVTFSGSTADVIHPNGFRIPCVKQPGRDIWWVPLDQIFEAPPLDYHDFVGVLGQGQPDVDSPSQDWTHLEKHPA
jgi:hypothetical protein